MADEPVVGKGGSLELDCCGGQKELSHRQGDGGHKYHHPSQGNMTSVEVDDGTGTIHTTQIANPQKAKVVIHYEVA